MTEIKTDEDASKASDQDPMDSFLGVTFKARDTAKYWRSISDLTATT